MLRVRISLIAVAACLTACSRDSVRAVGAVPDECSPCRLEMQRVAVLRGSLSGPNPVVGSKVVRNSLGHYYVAPTTDPERVLILSADGSYLGHFGSQGRGPGEFERVEQAMIIAGDSVAVSEVTRVSIFSPSGDFSRMVTTSAPVTAVLPTANGPGLLLGYQSRYAADFPFHVHLGNEIRHLGALGPSEYDVLTSSRVAGLGSRMTLWTARRNEYVIERYDILSGRRTGEWRRDVAWFPRHETAEEYETFLTRTQAIQERDDSLVWIAVSRRNPNPSQLDQRSFERTPNGEAIPRRASEAELVDLYDTYIELLNTRWGQALAAGTVEAFGGFLDTNHIYTYKETDTGDIEVHVWRLHIVSGATRLDA